MGNQKRPVPAEIFAGRDLGQLSHIFCGTTVSRGTVQKENVENSQVYIKIKWVQLLNLIAGALC
jgi:hypothetical protein